MELSLTKEKMKSELPIGKSALSVRAWTRQDLDTLAAWPKYPFPYEGFEFHFASMSSVARDEMFADRNRKPDAVPLIVDHTDKPAIGYISLMKINWAEGRVGNFGFRIHPEWMDQGIGTSVLRMVFLWCFDCGMSSVGVDVAASNARAVRCYEKVGFYPVGALWRNAADLKGVDITESRYDFLRSHLRLDGIVPELRFFLMEITPDTANG
jgi:RimJ/RimL family protein N-acetyltransferase